MKSWWDAQLLQAGKALGLLIQWPMADGSGLLLDGGIVWNALEDEDDCAQLELHFDLKAKTVKVDGAEGVKVTCKKPSASVTEMFEDHGGDTDRASRYAAVKLVAGLELPATESK